MIFYNVQSNCLRRTISRLFNILVVIIILSLRVTVQAGYKQYCHRQDRCTSLWSYVSHYTDVFILQSVISVLLPGLNRWITPAEINNWQLFCRNEITNTQTWHGLYQRVIHFTEWHNTSIYINANRIRIFFNANDLCCINYIIMPCS